MRRKILKGLGRIRGTTLLGVRIDKAINGEFRMRRKKLRNI